MISKQLVKLHDKMLNDGCFACIELWNSWYLPQNQPSPFRFINPHTCPMALNLLHSHLVAIQLYTSSNFDCLVFGQDKDVYLANCRDLIVKIRLFLDDLATSPWGSMSPG